MKICSKCKIAKPFSEFGKDKKMKNGIRYCCKKCNNAASVRWSNDNREKRLLSKQTYVLNNPEKNAESKAKYRRKNKQVLAIKNALYRQTYPEKNTMHGATRRARKLQATPAWLSREQRLEIVDFYKMAKQLETVFPWKQHVDHIVPLNNAEVCGLHVPWNLQILSVQANLEKGNKHYG